MKKSIIILMMLILTMPLFGQFGTENAVTKFFMVSDTSNIDKSLGKTYAYDGYFWIANGTNLQKVAFQGLPFDAPLYVINGADTLFEITTDGTAYANKNATTGENPYWYWYGYSTTHSALKYGRMNISAEGNWVLWAENAGYLGAQGQSTYLFDNQGGAYIDDKRLRFGSDNDAMYLYDETTNDALIFGLPISSRRSLIIKDIADISNDNTSLVGTTNFPDIHLLDTDEDSYLKWGWIADDEPEITANRTLDLQSSGDQDLNIFGKSGVNENALFKIWGDESGTPTFFSIAVEASGNTDINAEGNIEFGGQGTQIGQFTNKMIQMLDQRWISFGSSSQGDFRQVWDDSSHASGYNEAVLMGLGNSRGIIIGDSGLLTGNGGNAYDLKTLLPSRFSQSSLMMLDDDRDSYLQFYHSADDVPTIKSNKNIIVDTPVLDLTGDLYLADDKKIYGGDGQETSLEMYDEDGNDNIVFDGADVDHSGYYATSLQNLPDMQADGPALWFDGNGDVIIIPDDDVLEFGTVDFSILFKMNYMGTSGVAQGILNKGGLSGAGDWTIYIDTNDEIRFRSVSTGAVGLNANFTDYSNGWHTWVWVADVSTTGNGKIFRDGNDVTVGTVSAYDTYSNSDDFEIGRRQPTAANFSKMLMNKVFLFNLALDPTDADDKAIINGGPIPFKYLGASQAELMPNQVDRDFSGASAWADIDLSAYNETDDLTITADGIGQYCTLLVASAPTTIGKRYRMTYDLANIADTWTLKSFDGTQTIGTISANATQASVEWTATTTGGYRIVAVTASSSGDFDNFTLTPIGATFIGNPDGISNAVLVDKSGNDNNGAISGALPLGLPQELNLENVTNEDTDGGRETIIRGLGRQSGGERSTLASITISHDGSSDTQDGKVQIGVNDGNDNNSPTVAVTHDKNGSGYGTTEPAEKIHIDEAKGIDGTGRWFANASISTTDAVATTIYTLATTTDRAYRLSVNVIGAQDDGSNSMGALYAFTIKNVAGTLTEQGDVAIQETDDSAGVSMAGVVSGTDYLIQVTGINPENWNWEVSIDATVVAH